MIILNLFIVRRLTITKEKVSCIINILKKQELNDANVSKMNSKNDKIFVCLRQNLREWTEDHCDAVSWKSHGNRWLLISVSYDVIRNIRRTPARYFLRMLTPDE